MTRKPEQRSLEEVRELLRSLETTSAAEKPPVESAPLSPPATAAEAPPARPAAAATLSPVDAQSRARAPAGMSSTNAAEPSGAALKAILAISTAGICAAGIWYAFLVDPKKPTSSSVKTVLPIADATAAAPVPERSAPRPEAPVAQRAPATGDGKREEAASEPAGVRQVQVREPVASAPPGEPAAAPAPQDRFAQAALPKESSPLADARPAPPPIDRNPAQAGPRILLGETMNVQAGRSQPFPINVEPSDFRSIPAALIITGLPPGVSLGKGIVIQQGAWSVPVADLAQLTIALPNEMTGRFPLSIQLRLQNASLAATASSTLVVSPASQATPPAATMSDPARPDEAEIQRLLGEGKKQLQAGNIAAARLLFRRAADQGHGEAARLLGDTFDPAKLYVLGVKGTTGDMEKAIYWYERADELGDPQAKARLLSLGR